jgi:hypothetical protein
MPEDEESHEHKVTVMCEECGEIITVKNVAVFVLAMHLMYGCPAMGKTLHE